MENGMDMESTQSNFDSTVKTEQGDKDQSTSQSVKDQPQEQSTRVSFVNNDARITPSAVLQYVIDHDQPYDTIISCADGKIGGHRLVLASASPFIGTMFCSFNHRLGEVGTLILPDVRVEIMKALLNLCYTGKLIFAKEDESEILDAMRYLMIGEFANLTLKKVIVAEPVARRSTTSNQEQATSNQNAEDRLLDRELSPERPIPPCDSSDEEEEEEAEGDNDNNSKDPVEESSQDDLFEEVVRKKRKSREKQKTQKADATEPSSVPSVSDNQLNQSLQSNHEEEAGLQSKRSPPAPGKEKPKNTKRGRSTQKPTQMPTVLAMLHKASQKRKLAKEGTAEPNSDNLLSPGSPSENNPSKRLRGDGENDLPVALKTRRQTGPGPLRDRDNAPSFKTKPVKKAKAKADVMKQVDLDLFKLPFNFIRIRYPRLFVSEGLEETETAESDIPDPSEIASPKKHDEIEILHTSKENSQNSSLQDSFHPPSVASGNSDLYPDPDPDEAGSSIKSTPSKESLQLLDI